LCVFFAAAAGQFNFPETRFQSAREIFEQVNFDIYDGPAYVVRNQDGTLTHPTGAETTQGTGPDSEIRINRNGPFFRESAFIRGTSTTRFLNIGRFGGNTLQAQVTMILHEFAHNLNLIPSDSRNPNRSVENTKSILDRCKEAINKAIKSMR
jgi:hypothetical protein